MDTGDKKLTFMGKTSKKFEVSPAAFVECLDNSGCKIGKTVNNLDS